MEPRGLTEKQRRFVDFYIETGNATEAARRAGYSRRIANRQGAENLSKPVIRNAISAKLAELESKRVASATEVLQYLTAVMRGEEKETINSPDGSVQKVDMAQRDRIKAAELLMKRHGLTLSDVEIEEKKARIRQIEREESAGDDQEEAPVVHVYLPDNGRQEKK